MIAATYGLTWAETGRLTIHEARILADLATRKETPPRG